MPMSDFLQMVIRVFFSALAPAILCMIVGAIVIAKVYEKLRPGEPLPVRKVIIWMILVCYLAGLLTVTLFLRRDGSPGWQTHLFTAFWEAWNMFSLHFWLLYLLNIAMFIPLGVLLPLIARPFRRWYVTIPTGFGVSLLIECVQSWLSIGSADVDDLFCNTLGSALGYCLCMVVLSLRERKPGRGAAYGALPLLSAAALAGIFITYELQPYGNLMDGPVYAADTGAIQAWTADCDLSEQPRQVGIYYAEPFDHDGALAFGKAFAEKHGKVITEIENYDEWIMMRNPGVYEKGFYLEINLADRSYEYDDHNINCSEGGKDTPDDGTMPEEALREALAEYDIHIPEEAELIYEEERKGAGSYTFRAEQILEGDTMTDGYVTFQITNEGEIAEILNYMQTSQLVAMEDILSEAEAYRRLQEGRFFHTTWYGDWLREGAAEVRVQSCRLVYVTDTKGYRQPVYSFTFENRTGTMEVPALRDYRGP